MTLAGAKASRKANASLPLGKVRTAGREPDREPAAADLLDWYDCNRRALPWRAAAGAIADPYRVWLSEIMLQQTTVKAVAPYFDRFIARWPNVQALAAAALDDGARAGVQVSGAGVIAEPSPEFEHVIERRRGQCADVVPALQETGIIGRDGLDRGLLQHDFGEPDPVRIGALAGRRAPRQLAAMAVVPGQQGGGLRA